MVLGFRKETIDDVLTVIAAILLFNSIPKFQVVGGYFEEYPIIMVIVAVLIIANRKKIATKIGD